jgi:hypothetical protein
MSKSEISAELFAKRLEDARPETQHMKDDYAKFSPKQREILENSPLIAARRELVEMGLVRDSGRRRWDDRLGAYAARERVAERPTRSRGSTLLNECPVMVAICASVQPTSASRVTAMPRLHRDIELARSAITKLEMHYAKKTG